MPTISPQPTVVDQMAPPDPSEISHGVCACQVENTPRLALCGYDCTDEPEAIVVETICVVCEDIMRRDEPCRICGGLD